MKIDLGDHDGTIIEASEYEGAVHLEFTQPEVSEWFTMLVTVDEIRVLISWLEDVRDDYV